MGIEIKNYPRERICREFYDVIEFLKRYGAKGYNKNWHWARWEWLLGHPSLDESTLPRIGLFIDGGEIAGLVTHDMRNPAYIVLNPQYSYLKPEMADYAFENLARNGVSGIFADENDAELTSALKSKGYSPVEKREIVLELDCSAKLSYSLDDNFRITDYSAEKNIDEYVAVIHKGFENKGEPKTGLSEADFPEKPHENPRLAVFIAAQNGEYVSHCGTWYDGETETCYVEPVVTIPAFRGLGLGKAAVYESINRCAEMGAKKAVVISNQQFYHRIGFQKYSESRLWEKKTCPGAN